MIPAPSSAETRAMSPSKLIGMLFLIAAAQFKGQVTFKGSFFFLRQRTRAFPLVPRPTKITHLRVFSAASGSNGGNGNRTCFIRALIFGRYAKKKPPANNEQKNGTMHSYPFWGFVFYFFYKIILRARENTRKLRYQSVLCLISTRGVSFDAKVLSPKRLERIIFGERVLSIV